MVLIYHDYTAVIAGHSSIALSMLQFICHYSNGSGHLSLRHMREALIALHQEKCACAIVLDDHPWIVRLETGYKPSIHSSIHASIMPPPLAQKVDVSSSLVALSPNDVERCVLAVFIPLPTHPLPRPPSIGVDPQDNDSPQPDGSGGSSSDGSTLVDSQESFSHGFKKLQVHDTITLPPSIHFVHGGSGSWRKLPDPGSRFRDLIGSSGTLSVVKIHGLQTVARCLLKDTIFVFRRPAGFGLSTFASAVCYYFDKLEAHDGQCPWPLDSFYTRAPGLVHGFSVLLLDLSDPAIVSVETLVRYLARELEKLYIRWDGVIEDFSYLCRRDIEDVAQLGYAMHNIRRTHYIEALVIVDNYNHFEGRGPLDEEARKLVESLCDQARLGRISLVFLGHIKDEPEDSYEQWQRYPNRVHFEPYVDDMTYSDAQSVRESMGFTLDEVKDLALALGIPDDITVESLEGKGIQGRVFSEKFRGQWPTPIVDTFELHQESNMGRQVYPITPVLELLRELQGCRVINEDTFRSHSTVDTL
ncbi:hypothetical protein V5O48_002042 [Marasmius crinis-equi]|uniref:AAA-ATPase-like domain-containing protein n=1 Tax=Marasmius crinis-equi TaxID=585013 RepID=A0ABR3FXH5_9AGAR